MIRGLLESTLVIAMGEFGRTPVINRNAGRDHHSRVFSIMLAGGGVQGGQVIGASDPLGKEPAETPVRPEDLSATLYQSLGIDNTQNLESPDGVPNRPLTRWQTHSRRSRLDNCRGWVTQPLRLPSQAALL